MFGNRLRIVLVRHGLTDWNESGRLLGRIAIGLNERGRRQARALAGALADVPMRAVVSSPQQRTQETAQAIATARDVEVQTEAGLDEVWLGRWQGKTFDEIREDPDLLPLLADPTHVCDAIEPAAEVQSRVVTVVEAFREANEPGPVVLVSHGDPLRVLLAHYLGMNLRHYRRLAVDPGSASILNFDGRGTQLLALNWKPVPGLLQRLLA
jgi:broad specificity phosphatase PhoE